MFKGLSYVNTDTVQIGDRVIDKDIDQKFHIGVIIDIKKEFKTVDLLINFFDKNASWHNAIFIFKEI